MKKIKLDISPIELRSIIISHGWYALKPFFASTNPLMLSLTFDFYGNKGLVKIIPYGKKCMIQYDICDKNYAIKIAHNILSLDIDITSLYKNISTDSTLSWLSSNKIGRFLKSPTLFEDCCKAILATNTTFNRTISMVNDLVETYGTLVTKNHKAFPLPENIILDNETAIRNKIKCGFRAKYIIDLCLKTIKNKDFFINNQIEKFNNYEFYNKLIEVNGIGSASANYISRMYYKAIGFHIDSWVKKKCYELWNLKENQIESFLKKKFINNEYGPYILWFQITKHWHKRESNSDNKNW